MKSTITITYVKENEELDTSQGNFMINDIAGAMKQLGIFVPIVCIHSYDSSQNEKEEIISDIVKLFDMANGRGNQFVLCTTSYVSTSEFPESEWDISKDLAKKENKKLIPVNKILDRDSELLEDIGWININGYVQYDLKRAYIYSNEYGNRIAKYFSELNKEAK